MCKNATTHAFLKALPKCEHHCHIEGTLSPDLMLTLCKRNKVLPPSSDLAFASEEALLERYDRFTSLDDFLHYYYIAMSGLVTAQDFEDMAWAYFLTVASDGVAHAEISFDPQAHAERGIAFSTVTSGLMAARRRAELELGMSTQMICCFLRHLPAQSALELMEAKDFQSAVSDGSIVGIGLDSSENGFPPELFKEVYHRAKELGLRLTAHAGEEGPAENIKTALDVLGCARIDHGIRLADRPDMVEAVAQSRTMLTVCPLSNVRLRCAEKVADLPIRRFLDAGVQFSINSDDPAYFGGFLLANYCAVQEAFQLDKREWKQVCQAAIGGSWCSSTRTQQLLDQTEACCISFPQID